jgi:hypothetical protein
MYPLPAPQCRGTTLASQVRLCVAPVWPGRVWQPGMQIAKYRWCMESGNSIYYQKILCDGRILLREAKATTLGIVLHARSCAMGEEDVVGRLLLSWAKAGKDNESALFPIFFNFLIFPISFPYFLC